MNREERIMRLHIEGSWTASDMADSFSSIRKLYDIRLGLQVVSEEWPELNEILSYTRQLRQDRGGLLLSSILPSSLADLYF